MTKQEIEDERLIIFGYGSLVWKQNFPFTERFNGYVKNYIRRFYQGSTDHRGTEENPGRVVTLLYSKGSHVFGSAFIIDTSDKQKVLDYLDLREKDGYSQFYVDIYEKPDDEIPKLKNALIYIANEKNIRFLGKPEGGAKEIAHHILKSVGPSGKNVDYFLNLLETIRNFKIYDDHLEELDKYRLEILKENENK